MSSLESALAILGLLNQDRPVLRVSEVCRDLAIPKSSVSRLLRTMSAFGLIERDPQLPGYRAGPRSLLLANLYMTRYGLIELVDRALDDLVAEFGFTGYVSALSDTEIVLLRLKQGSYPLRYVRDIGTRLPAARTAMGHALLARLTDAEVETRFAELAAEDRAGLRAGLAAVRRQGFSRRASQLTPGLSTVSAALRDPDSGSLMALGLAYPDSAADGPLPEHMTRRVLQTARDIGLQIKDPAWTEPASSG